MARRTRLALALLLVPAACASPSPDEQFAELSAEIQDLERERNCGVRGAMGFGGEARAQAGDAVRACGLPTAADVEWACKVHEARAIPGTVGNDPLYPDDPEYEFPDYSVSELECAFTDASNSGAVCSFGLAPGAAAPQATRIELTHGFYTHNTPLTFEYGTRWSTAGSCLADTSTGRPG